MDHKALFPQIVSFIASVHQVKHDLTKEISIDGITPVQYGILELLAVDQPMTLSQICECRDMSMPNASRELKKLIDNGLCIKFSTDEDRRKQYISLSPHGEEVMEQAFAHIWKQLQLRLESISSEQLAELPKAMELLQHTLFSTQLSK